MASGINVVGTVATDPKEIILSTGTQLCSFRFASTERRYDRKTESWVNADTNWFTVNIFNVLANHALQSFHKGDRLVVSGRLRIKQWERDGKTGTSVEIDADALGHDVRWGVSSFQKSAQTASAQHVTSGAGANGWHAEDAPQSIQEQPNDELNHEKRAQSELENSTSATTAELAADIPF